MTVKEALLLAILPAEDEGRLMNALRCLQGADSEPLLTIEDIARRLQVHPGTVHRHKVPVALKVGGQNRYRWSDVVRHFEGRG